MFVIFHIFIASDQALCGVRTGENNSPTLPWVTGFVESLLSGIKYSLTDLYFFKVTCTLIGGEVFWDCRPHFSSPANKLFYLDDRRERGSKRRREGRENSPPPPRFRLSPLVSLARLLFTWYPPNGELASRLRFSKIFHRNESEHSKTVNYMYTPGPSCSKLG